MKKLMLMSMVIAMLLLPACDLFGTEEVEEPTFEEFVETEMEFGRSKTSESMSGKPLIKVTADEGYEVGKLIEDPSDGVVVVNPDEKTKYLLELRVVEADEEEDMFEGIEPDENGVYSTEWDNSAMKLIPLSEDYYCEVYAENAADMEVFEHITIEEVEPEPVKNDGMTRKKGTTHRPTPRNTQNN